MSLVIPRDVIDEIRFEANYLVYKDAMVRLDPIRFRGLGDQHTERFIRHGVNYCDKVEIEYVNDVAYVLFIMCYLGSFFYEEHRYSEIRNILESPVLDSDTRIDRARQEFIKFGNTYIGSRSELYIAALRNFSTNAIPLISMEDAGARECVSALRSCYPHADGIWSSEDYQHLISAAQLAARELSISCLRGAKLCLFLCYWLGCGFYKDPLLPWVRDMTSDKSL